MELINSPLEKQGILEQPRMLSKYEIELLKQNAKQGLEYLQKTYPQAKFKINNKAHGSYS